MNRNLKFICLLALLPLLASAAQPTRFSNATPSAALPAGWSVQPIPKVERQIRFDLVDDTGTTLLRDVYVINRGYEDLPNRLNALGAKIESFFG